MSGYKVVPVEPTAEMLEAAREHHEGDAYLPVSLYRAMLAAAPAVQGEPDHPRLRQRFDEIEREICEGKHTASSVFTQMRTAVFYAAPQPVEQQADSNDSLTPVPDGLFAAEFAGWWEEYGQFCRSGGGNYERTFAFEAWRHLYPQLVNLQTGSVEQQPAPDVSGLTSALRQYQHNDGSGLVFGYDKSLADQCVAQLVEALEWIAGADCEPGEGATDFAVAMGRGIAIGNIHRKAKAALAAHRKGGE